MHNKKNIIQSFFQWPQTDASLPPHPPTDSNDIPGPGTTASAGHGEVNLWDQSSRPDSHCQTATPEMFNGLEQRVRRTVTRSTRCLWCGPAWRTRQWGQLARYKRRRRSPPSYILPFGRRSIGFHAFSYPISSDVPQRCRQVAWMQHLRHHNRFTSVFQDGSAKSQTGYPKIFLALYPHIRHTDGGSGPLSRDGCGKIVAPMLRLIPFFSLSRPSYKILVSGSRRIQAATRPCDSFFFFFLRTDSIAKRSEAVSHVSMVTAQPALLEDRSRVDNVTVRASACCGNPAKVKVWNRGG